MSSGCDWRSVLRKGLLSIRRLEVIRPVVLILIMESPSAAIHRSSPVCCRCWSLICNSDIGKNHGTQLLLQDGMVLGVLWLSHPVGDLGFNFRWGGIRESSIHHSVCCSSSRRPNSWNEDGCSVLESHAQTLDE
jgi:hypothetical protein